MSARRLLQVAVVLVCVFAVAAAVMRTSLERSGSPSPSPAPSANADAAGIVWLCIPGRASNPCTGDLSTTVLDAAGSRTAEQPQVAKDPPIDCFYVYPTISRQKTANASLTIDPEETAVAVAQGALFSQVCVYAAGWTDPAFGGRMPRCAEPSFFLRSVSR